MSGKNIWNLSESESENEDRLASDLPENSYKTNNKIDNSIVRNQSINSNLKENLLTCDDVMVSSENKKYGSTNDKILNFKDSNVICISSDSEDSLPPEVESVLHVSNTFYLDSETSLLTDVNSTAVSLLKPSDLTRNDSPQKEYIKSKLAENSNTKSVSSIKKLVDKTTGFDNNILQFTEKDLSINHQSINESTIKKVSDDSNSKSSVNKSDLKLDSKISNLEDSSVSFSNHGIYLDDFDNFEYPCTPLSDSFNFQTKKDSFLTEKFHSVASKTPESLKNVNQEKHSRGEIFCIDLTEETSPESEKTKKNHQRSIANSSNAKEVIQSSMSFSKESFSLNTSGKIDSSINSSNNDDSFDSLDEEIKKSVFNTYRMRKNNSNVSNKKLTKTKESELDSIKVTPEVDLVSQENLKRKTTPPLDYPLKKKTKVSLPEKKRENQAKSKKQLIDTVQENKRCKTKEIRVTSVPKVSENDQNTEFINKERLKALKPENCMQHVTCQIDESLVEKVKLSMETISKLYDNCNFEKVNIMHPCVCWVRTIPNGLLEEPDVEMSKHTYLFYTASELAELLFKTDKGKLHCSLKNFLIKTKQQRQSKVKFHLICFGFEKFKTKVRRKELPAKSSKLNDKASVVTVSKLEKAVIAFEFKMKIDFVFVEELKDLMVLLQQLTKSIAEEPYKNATRKAIVCTSSGSSIKVS